MESNEFKGVDERENRGLAKSSSVVAAFFEEREQAEVALSDLDRSGIPGNKIGVAYSGQPRKEPPSSLGGSTEKEKILFPPPATAGVPGWTMGMAPWTITGVGPLVVRGALSLAPREARPGDLRGFASSLGLRREAVEQMEAAFQRHAVLVTVEAPDQEVIASHILERNGGKTLPRK